MIQRLLSFFRRPRSEADANLSEAPLNRLVRACLGSLIGIGLCAYLSTAFFEPRGATLLIGSFGASAVLLFAAEDSPLAQPRNLLGGQVLSAAAGVLTYQVLGTAWLAAGVAVSLSIGLMVSTRTLHPPGGATALIAVIGGDRVHQLGLLYLVVPVALGSVALLGVALVVNNMSARTRYPRSWW